MNRISLNKKQTTAVRLMVMAFSAFAVLGHGEVGYGQTSQVGTPQLCGSAAHCQQLAEREAQQLKKDLDSACQKSLDKLEKTRGDFYKACGESLNVPMNSEGEASKPQCILRAEACVEAEKAKYKILGENDILKLLTSKKKADESELEDVCKQIYEAPSTCPEMAYKAFGSTSRRGSDIDDLESKRDRAEENLERLMKEQTEKQSKAQKELMEMNNSLQDEQTKVQRQQQELRDKIAASIQSIGDQKKAKYQEARASFLQIEEGYIKMRDELRQSESAVQSVAENLEAVCREEASERFGQAEAERKKRIAAEQAAGPRNFDSSKIAGESTSRANKNAKNRNMDYTAFYNECKSGMSAKGRRALNAISAAKRENSNRQQKLIEEATLVEKKRAEMLARIAEMEQQASQQEKQMAQQLETQIAQLGTDFENAKQKAARAMASLQQEQAQQYMMFGSQIQQAQTKVNTYGSKVELSTVKSSCLARYEGIDKEEATTKKKSNQEATGYFMEFVGVCAGLTNTCSNATTVGDWQTNSGCGSWLGKATTTPTVPAASQGGAR
jgi:hypothetical protein